MSYRSTSNSKIQLTTQEARHVNKFLRKIAELREAYDDPVDWLSRTPNRLKETLLKKTSRDFLKPYNKSGDNIAHLAAAEGDVTILRMLMNKGIEGRKALTARNNNNQTPLVVAHENLRFNRSDRPTKKAYNLLVRYEQEYRLNQLTTNNGVSNSTALDRRNNRGVSKTSHNTSRVAAVRTTPTAWRDKASSEQINGQRSGANR